MWVPVLIVIGMGLLAYHRFGSATSFSFHSMTPSLRFNDIIFWSVLTFAFGGCETASFMAEEIKNARRTIPLALFVAGITIAFCYIVGTVCVLLALPSTEVSSLQGLVQAVAKTADRVGLPWFLPVAAFLIALSNIGASGAYLAAVARLPFVAGIDRYLPASFGALHPRWGTPWVALLTQAIIGAIFIFLGQAGTSVKGAYDVLVSMGVITYFVPLLVSIRGHVQIAARTGGRGSDPGSGWQASCLCTFCSRIRHHVVDDCAFSTARRGRAEQTACRSKSCRRLRRPVVNRGGFVLAGQATRTSAGFASKFAGGFVGFSGTSNEVIILLLGLRSVGERRPCSHPRNFCLRANMLRASSRSLPTI